MKLIDVMCCATVLCSVLVAQVSQTETKSKIRVKDGKDITVTGCVTPTVKGESFMLTSVADKTRARSSYMLVSAKDELSKHVGHLVRISGEATDRGEGTLKVDTKSKTKVEDGDDKETHTKSEVSGDLIGLPYLEVKSVKLIAARCP